MVFTYEVRASQVKSKISNVSPSLPLRIDRITGKESKIL